MSEKLITADEIAEASQRIYDEWPRERFQDLRRYIMDTLHDARILAETYEDAARLRSSPTQDHAKACHKMAAGLICPPAAEDEPDQRARKAGIGA